MVDILFWIAAAIAAIWCLVHVFLGGREVAAPLKLAQDLDPLARDVQYLCWHFTTVSIAAMALLFALAVLEANHAYAVAGTILAGGFSVVGIALVTAIGQSHRRAPQGWLLVPITALGLVGLLLG